MNHFPSGTVGVSNVVPDLDRFFGRPSQDALRFVVKNLGGAGDFGRKSVPKISKRILSVILSAFQPADGNRVVGVAQIISDNGKSAGLGGHSALASENDNRTSRGSMIHLYSR